jgi:hypothetical protein
MKGAAVFTMCEFGRLTMLMGAGNYGRNGTILRTLSMRYDGMGRDGVAIVDGSMAMADGSIMMVAALLSKILLLGSTESKHPYE